LARLKKEVFEQKFMGASKSISLSKTACTAGGNSLTLRRPAVLSLADGAS
jgi:hypothetical protein